MNPRIAWLSAVANDPRISHIDVRVAVAIAALADEHGRLKSRMAMLSERCNINVRRMVNHLQRLAETGHIKAVDLSRQGRFHIEVVSDTDAAAPATTKPFREVDGAVVAAIDQPAANGRHRMTLYIEAEDEMVKVTIPRNGAETIAAAIPRVSLPSAPNEA